MFIVFEGLDGSGSSTQSRLLSERLERSGRQVTLTHEPTDEGALGQLIRQTLQHSQSFSPEALQLLICADRAEHLNALIRPALAEGKAVISARYFLSTLAFGGLNCDMSWLKSINQPFPLPDLTFLLKLEPEKCLERIATRGSQHELFEKKELLEKVWHNYQKAAAEYPNIHILDADRPMEEVAEEVWGVVNDALEAQKMKQDR